MNTGSAAVSTVVGSGTLASQNKAICWLRPRDVKFWHSVFAFRIAQDDLNHCFASFTPFLVASTYRASSWSRAARETAPVNERSGLVLDVLSLWCNTSESVHFSSSYVSVWTFLEDGKPVLNPLGCRVTQCHYVPAYQQHWNEQKANARLTSRRWMFYGFPICSDFC